MVAATDDSIETIIGLERRSLTADVRRSPDEVDALLDPEFREIGAPDHLVLCC